MDPEKRNDPQPMGDSRILRRGPTRTKIAPCPTCGEMMNLTLKRNEWTGVCQVCRKSVP